MKDDYEYINSEYSEYIENVNHTRDLGIVISNDIQFSEHIEKVVTKSRQKCGWINRSFINKSVDFRRKMWRTYIETVWTMVHRYGPL